MTSGDKIPSNLEKRFCQPDGWRWHSFERAGRHIRFGSVFPENSTPDAVVVCLQGVREFSEKYYETARWCLDHNLAFWTFDWAGQGKSSRYLPNPHKRHSTGFDQDVEDLHYFIMEYIKHASVSPDKGRIPMAMLAHSMGANLGLRYLMKYPDQFECAAFSAPMIGIKAFQNVPQRVALVAAQLCNLFVGKKYIPGGNDWGKHAEHARLSQDPLRNDVDTLWCKADHDLQCGDVTYGWVYAAQKSCFKIQKKYKDIKTPCFFGLSGYEDLVDNDMARKTIAKMENAKIVEYTDAFHEILMEKNEIRDGFLDHFYRLINETIIDCPETLKPF